MLRQGQGGAVRALIGLGLAASLSTAELLGGGMPVSQTEQSSPDRVQRVRSIVNQYCVTCHNGTRKAAGLELDLLDVANVEADPETWEKVVGKLRAGAMPPAGARRPQPADYELVASHLETSLDRAAAASPNPGRGAVARLNRAEYTNAIRDLLALEIDGQSMLPADDSGYGFDNIADVLSTSPALLERYLSAAQKISRQAIGAAVVRPSVESYPLHNDYRQDGRMGEDFAFGTRGGLAVRHYFPADGEYVLKIRLQRQANKDVGPIRGTTKQETLEVRLDGVRIAEFTVGGPGSDDAASSLMEDERMDDALETRFAAKRGARRISVTFTDLGLVPETLRPRLPVRNWAYTYSTQTQMGVDRFTIGGPYDVSGFAETESGRRIFVCRPSAPSDADACATNILTTLARRAYRRPVTKTDLDPLLHFYRVGSSKGGFEAGIELALTRILVSPHFLFRTEAPPAGVSPGEAYAVSELALASRLSFFLWSSIPDDGLLDLASRGELRAPIVLVAQVRRMFADDRAQALISDFFGQWLYLRNIQLVVPDAKRFPDFDNNLRDAFQKETELFVESQLREDRSVTELLTANYTFLNERLAQHYGIPGVYGSHFRRVTYPDRARGGLLGHGSLLTVTSYADRTSPVMRGKWVLENILGTPPPPPPADVPALDESAGGDQPQSTRQRMERHRRNPVCATCHQLMDPIGFALENFDAIGRWRIEDKGAPIDASGALGDGSEFNGPAELRGLLARRQQQFATTVIEKLLTYALGRGLEYYDAPAVRAIEREAAEHGYRWSAIIAGVVDNVPFQMRRSQ